METLSLLVFVTATSGFPSKLKSPMLTELGVSPVGKSTLGAKVGVVAPVAVVLRRMEVVFLVRKFTVAKSGFPSKLKSPMLSDLGRGPAGKFSLGGKAGVGGGGKG